jgi:hypothetical protein
LSPLQPRLALAQRFFSPLSLSDFALQESIVLLEPAGHSRDGKPRSNGNEDRPADKHISDSPDCRNETSRCPERFAGLGFNMDVQVVNGPCEFIVRGSLR